MTKNLNWRNGRSGVFPELRVSEPIFGDFSSGAGAKISSQKTILTQLSPGKNSSFVAA